MPADYVLPLADERADLATAGGKGASLARLAAAGLPVPGGFHITTAAYQQFVADNQLQAAILAAVAGADPAQPASLQTAASQAQALFEHAHLPPAIADAIARAYTSLGEADGDGDPAVAVRSSATAEDLPGLSFAGQQETYLNVRGRVELLAAVQRCWGSLWTARAIGYRAQHAIDQGTVSLAVVVQRLVCAQAAGVLFTANPVTGQRDEVMITAAWGLGEALVGGQVTPDTLTVEKATGRGRQRVIADKQVMTVRTEHGTREEPTPAHLRRAPVLDEAAAAELARLGAQIEQFYGAPMDIEWARADGRFALLQARPITALPPPEAPLPSGWPLPGKGPFMRGSIVDFMPEPLSPLFATLGRAHYNRSFQQLVAWFTHNPRTRMFSLVTINGYGYMSVDIDWRSGLSIASALLRLPQLVRAAVPRWRDEAAPRYAETVARWQACALESRGAGELLAGVDELVGAAMDHLTTLQGGIMGIAGTAEALFTGVYDKLVRRAGDPPAATFLLGYDSTPILADKALYDLAQWVYAQAGLVDFVRGRSAARLAADLVSPQAPDGVDEAVWRELRARWQAHLERYGAMIYTLDFARPLPADEPAPLLETLKLYLGRPAPDPHTRQQKLAEQRAAAQQATLPRLTGWRLRLLRTVLGWAQAVAPLREDGIAYLGHGYPQLRRVLKELGRRLAQVGAIQQPGEVFWLNESELRAAVAALDQGQGPTPLAGVVQQRQAEWRAQRRLTPPPSLPPMKKYLGMKVEAWLPASGDAHPAQMLKGIAASPGRVTAPACVLHGPEEFDQMRPGSVLVAEITTPAWTPLFARAAAVVTDIGGPLSHGSIVAREYGLPAVMGTGVATRRICPGQMITVDGDAGTVSLADSGGGGRPG